MSTDDVSESHRFSLEEIEKIFVDEHWNYGVAIHEKSAEALYAALGDPSEANPATRSSRVSTASTQGRLRHSGRPGVREVGRDPLLRDGGRLHERRRDAERDAGGRHPWAAHVGHEVRRRTPYDGLKLLGAGKDPAELVPARGVKTRAVRLALGRDVEVHAEQVRRIELRLKGDKPLVVASVARPDELLLLFAEAGEVEIEAAR
jgi:hypothetical protein